MKTTIYEDKENREIINTNSINLILTMKKFSFTPSEIYLA